MVTLVPVVHVAGPYSNQRLFEWAMAVMMVLIAVTLALPGDTMDRGALRPLVQAGLTEGNLATFFGAFGTVRCFALLANGYINNGIAKPSGAVLRAVGSGAGAFIWGQMMLVLAWDAITASAPSFLIPIFGTLMVFEIVSCRRAKNDAVERKLQSPHHTKLEMAMNELRKAHG